MRRSWRVAVEVERRYVGMVLLALRKQLPTYDWRLGSKSTVPVVGGVFTQAQEIETLMHQKEWNLLYGSVMRIVATVIDHASRKGL